MLAEILLRDSPPAGAHYRWRTAMPPRRRHLRRCHVLRRAHSPAGLPHPCGCTESEAAPVRRALTKTAALGECGGATAPGRKKTTWRLLKSRSCSSRPQHASGSCQTKHRAHKNSTTSGQRGENLVPPHCETMSRSKPTFPCRRVRAPPTRVSLSILLRQRAISSAASAHLSYQPKSWWVARTRAPRTWRASLAALRCYWEGWFPRMIDLGSRPKPE